MQKYLISVLTVVFIHNTAFAVTEIAKCGRGSCGYNKNLIEDVWNGGTAKYGYTAQECFDIDASAGVSSYCSVIGMCVDGNNTGYDSYKFCSGVCDAKGYDVLVYDQDISAGTLKWTCACATQDEWQTYKTGVLRKYEQLHSSAKGCYLNPLNEYKCALGYYGPNNSPNGCKVCPDNATCGGGTSFICKSGYYKNSSGTGCVKCPDSKEGGLGWDNNGNGVPAINGGVYELCEISSGTILYDAKGRFIVGPDEIDGCTP